MPPVLPVLRVTGPGRNVGKTWLARHLIQEFTRRGYAVGAVKRSHHALPPDKPGSDTDLFARAGAPAVTFATPAGTLVRVPAPAPSLAALVEPYLGRVDLVIVEGFKDDTLGAVARIEQPADERGPGLVTLRRTDGRVFLETRTDHVAGIVAACEQEFALSPAGEPSLRAHLRRAAVLHGDRCAGVALGVRMALAGLEALGMDCPPPLRRLSVTAHAAHCIVDAIAATTGCSIGTRTLTVRDLGELSADFVDRASGRTWRIAAHPGLRAPACGSGPAAADWQSLESACRLVPDGSLFTIRESPGLRAHIPAAI